MDRIHLEVRGKVQGVGFRWFVAERARRLGLAGWVKNRSDGNVEVAAAGDRESIEILVAAVREGPSGARVEEVRQLEANLDGDLGKPFRIHR
jgi:acylphosphatase